VPSDNLITLFLEQVRARGSATALRSKRDGQWVPTSWTEWERRARAVAEALVAWGVQKGDRVAIFGNTREEWVIADMGVLLAGATTVPIYPSLVGDQAAYIVRDSGARVLFAEDASFVARLREGDAKLVDGLLRTVLFSEMPVPALAGQTGDAPADAAARVNERVAASRPDDLATLVYTSGTTGPPKGVMLTHGNLAADAEGLAKVVPMTADDEQLLFLPLAHIFGKMLVVAALRLGYATAFAETMLKALDNAAEVRPTFMGAVPRVFEKVYGVANEKAAAAGGMKQRLFTWATEVGKRKQGGWGGFWADRLVLSKIRARFGGRIKFLISAGAPLAKELADWFDGAGIPVLEAYGLTETSGGATMNALGRQRYGTVGPALPGVEMKIAPDGEVLVRGPTVMKGYWGQEQATREVIDTGGWFHTGDIGEMDGDGFLRITDRKKDIIVTAGGKNVAPQNIESLMKQSSWVSQAMVYGDKRPFLVALVTLNVETVARFAREKGIAGEPDALTLHAEVRAEVQREVDAMNARLSSFETVKRFAILERDFTIEGGELTPTLKVKRKVVSDRYKTLLENLYLA
jgi:long-chain acyl-CoA synthetase